MKDVDFIKSKLLDNRLTLAWLHYRLRCLGHELSIEELRLLLSGLSRHPKQGVILLDCKYILNLYDDLYAKHLMLNESTL